MSIFRNNRALLDAFRRGDADALEKVYWHYVDLVSHAARRGVSLSDGRRVPGVAAQDLCDVVQDVFVRAFSEKARSSYDGLRPYRPYLMTVCRNLIIDRGRKNGREIPVDDIFDGFFDAEVGPDLVPRHQEEAWDTPDVMATVEQYIQSLDEPLSSVYYHRFKIGDSQAKTAKALGIGRQRIRSLEKKIREGLAVALDVLVGI